MQSEFYRLTAEKKALQKIAIYPRGKLVDQLVGQALGIFQNWVNGLGSIE